MKEIRIESEDVSSSWWTIPFSSPFCNWRWTRRVILLSLSMLSRRCSWAKQDTAESKGPGRDAGKYAVLQFSFDFLLPFAFESIWLDEPRAHELRVLFQNEWVAATYYYAALDESEYSFAFSLSDTDKVIQVVFESPFTCISVTVCLSFLCLSVALKGRLFWKDVFTGFSESARTKEQIQIREELLQPVDWVRLGPCTTRIAWNVWVLTGLYLLGCAVHNTTVIAADAWNTGLCCCCRRRTDL